MNTQNRRRHDFHEFERQCIQNEQCDCAANPSDHRGHIDLIEVFRYLDDHAPKMMSFKIDPEKQRQLFNHDDQPNRGKHAFDGCRREHGRQSSDLEPRKDDLQNTGDRNCDKHEGVTIWSSSCVVLPAATSLPTSAVPMRSCR